MNTTNRRRYESVVRVLALCEEQGTGIESTPPGTQLIGQLRASAAKAAGLFQTQSSGRNSVHDATAKRRALARLVSKNAAALARHARALAPTSGLAIELPPLRKNSDEQLIADSRALLDAVQPLAATFKAGKLTGLDDLTKQIADLDAAMKEQSAGRETHVGASATINQVLNECIRLTTAIEPFYVSAINGDPELIARWRNARRIGPARPGKDDAPADATVATPAKPAADKVA